MINERVNHRHTPCWKCVDCKVYLCITCAIKSRVTDDLKIFIEEQKNKQKENDGEAAREICLAESELT